VGSKKKKRRKKGSSTVPGERENQLGISKRERVQGLPRFEEAMIEGGPRKNKFKKTISAQPHGGIASREKKEKRVGPIAERGITRYFLDLGVNWTER